MYPGYQRFFSRAAGHYKDLTETGNRARKVSGTQGSLNGANRQPTRNVIFNRQSSKMQIIINRREGFKLRPGLKAGLKVCSEIVIDYLVTIKIPRTR